ncbi:hypothetical protein ES288_A04G039700v1 [Gossypium darwinii]|uniref:Uncharacterized protein n=1 Tax=Gossypium darwinii TaxID=34276 RepID=A0A5D2GTZ1_GOSDA|nr:hypothetical protein ES288_A04G039700v1 [Gossypium darwinii]
MSRSGVHTTPGQGHKNLCESIPRKICLYDPRQTHKLNALLYLFNHAAYPYKLSLAPVPLSKALPFN